MMTLSCRTSRGLRVWDQACVFPRGSRAHRLCQGFSVLAVTLAAGTQAQFPCHEVLLRDGSAENGVEDPRPEVSCGRWRCSYLSPLVDILMKAKAKPLYIRFIYQPV